MIGDNKADFNFKTWHIIKSIFCCLACKSRSKMNKQRDRNNYFFEKGFEKLDKELDIAEIIKQLRNIKYVMKILLDKD